MVEVICFRGLFLNNEKEGRRFEGCRPLWSVGTLLKTAEPCQRGGGWWAQDPLGEREAAPRRPGGARGGQ